MKKIIVGISGASGTPLAVRLLEALRDEEKIETHLVMTKSAEETVDYETDITASDIKKLANEVYDISDMAAAISSGTFKTEGMIICPCSMKTVAGIASGYSDNLLLRAADVALKENRKLVVVARETPLSVIHLRNLHEIAKAGAIILPPMQTYYNLPGTVDDLINHTVGKILDCFDIDFDGLKRWKNKE